MITIKYLYKLIYQAIKPKSEIEDEKRKEFILNILLVSSIILLLVGSVISTIDLIKADPVVRSNSALSLSVIFLIIFIFLVLYFLSRKGFFRIASYFLLAIFFSLATYMGYRWGVDGHASLLFYVLIIVMSGVLIDTFFAFVVSIISIATIFIIGYFQISGAFNPNLYWKNGSLKMADILMFSIFFMIIAIVSWLSNREIERSLSRARRSERELKKERDFLEVKIKERIAELKLAQIEQVSQLYRFAEFGKLSSGLFHDLINPLTAACLNIERIKNDYVHEVQDVESHLDKAVMSIKRMENFIIAVKKQMSKKKTELFFSVIEEINSVIQVLDYKAKKTDVEIIFFPEKPIMTYGDPVKFNQIVLNLVVNALDSYSNMNGAGRERKVEVEIILKDNMIHLAVQDRGCGIAPEYMNKIFQPFFTTKGEDEGTGIGLSLTKRIIENDFGGTIDFESEKNKGTKFIVIFPAVPNKKA